MNSALSSVGIETRVILQPSERGKWLSGKFLKPLIINDGFPVVLYAWRVNFCILFHRNVSVWYITTTQEGREHSPGGQVIRDPVSYISYHGILWKPGLSYALQRSVVGSRSIPRASPPETFHSQVLAAWLQHYHSCSVSRNLQGHLMVLRPGSVLPLTQLSMPTTERSAGGLVDSILTSCILYIKLSQPS